MAHPVVVHVVVMFKSPLDNPVGDVAGDAWTLSIGLSRAADGQEINTVYDNKGRL